MLPSDEPSQTPSASPSRLPSVYPSYQPTKTPSAFPSILPTTIPSFFPTMIPSRRPSLRPSSVPIQTPIVARKKYGSVIGTVIGAVSGSVFLILIGLCWKRCRSENPPYSIPHPQHEENEQTEIPHRDVSLLSGDSLISIGSSVNSGSGDEFEYDDTQNLADEFDKYKDQNVEKMRTEVSGTLSGADGMMCRALAKALMDDMDEDIEETMDNLWGGWESMEIEASVLCDVNDWLKRKEQPTVDERRDFVEDALNKMVTCVRQGVIAPEDASRTIHGSAAMLKLKLQEELPETALIITGMRKKVTKEDVVEAFNEFGDIEGAAVSPNSRGFGLVRYHSTKSVQRAMERHRTGEIVVQDVAVTIKVLKSDESQT